MWILKVGGRQLDEPGFISGLAQVLKLFPQPPIIVHGGGRGTTSLVQRLGLEAHFVEGLRVTDESVLEAAIMGLAGLAKMQLVAGLVAAGVPALGLSGVDGGLVRCRPLLKPAGLGMVGEPARVDAERLLQLVAQGWVVCLCPLSLDEEGKVRNLNADPVAAAVAVAVRAETLVFLTDVEGVLVDGISVPQLDRALFHDLLERGQLGEGMLPKLRACFAALDEGVEQVLVSNLDGVRDWLGGKQAGTVVRHARLD